MDSYVIRQGLPKQSWKQRIFSSIVAGGLFACLMFCFKTFWPSPSDIRHGLSGRAIGSAAMGLVWGCLMPWFQNSGDCELEVDESSITSIWGRRGLIRWTIRRTVHKGKIRTFIDLKTRSGAHRGLFLSERSEWVSRIITGYVFIPNTLPEYEDLRHLAESWRIPEARG